MTKTSGVGLVCVHIYYGNPNDNFTSKQKIDSIPFACRLWAKGYSYCCPSYDIRVFESSVSIENGIIFVILLKYPMPEQLNTTQKIAPKLIRKVLAKPTK